MVRMVVFRYISSKALGGFKQVLYIWHWEMYHQLYVCVLFGARGSTYQDSEPMFKEITSSPFSAKTPAQCTMPHINNRHEKSRPCSLLLLR